MKRRQRAYFHAWHRHSSSELPSSKTIHLGFRRSRRRIPPSMDQYGLPSTFETDVTGLTIQWKRSRLRRIHQDRPSGQQNTTNNSSVNFFRAVTSSTCRGSRHLQRMNAAGTVSLARFLIYRSSSVYSESCNCRLRCTTRFHRCYRV